MKLSTKIIGYCFFLVVFLLLSYEFYLSKSYYPATIGEFISSPAQHEGTETEFTGPLINLSETYFYMSVNQVPLKVYFSGQKSPKSGQIYARVILNRDLTATAIETHNMNYNYFKYYVSAFGFILFLLIFFKEWKIKKLRFVENA